jgi:hypothetical protein
MSAGPGEGVSQDLADGLQALPCFTSDLEGYVHGGPLPT